MREVGFVNFYGMIARGTWVSIGDPDRALEVEGDCGGNGSFLRRFLLFGRGLGYSSAGPLGGDRFAGIECGEGDILGVLGEGLEHGSAVFYQHDDQFQ
jgi:hypothetical protein